MRSGDGGRGPEHDHALRIGARQLEVVAHEDAVEAELLRVSGLVARARRRSVGAGLQHHRDLQPAAHRPLPTGDQRAFVPEAEMK
jgi:hypothetical protein